MAKSENRRRSGRQRWDGATFLWFQYRLIQVEVLRMALGIILIVMHLHGDKLGEYPHKILRSTGLYNGGANGTHGSAILITLAWLMTQHGQDRSIRSLTSHAINSFSSICNRKWLMISGLGENTTSNSLFYYFKSQFDPMGIGRNGIVLVFNISKLLPVLDQLNGIRNIQQHLSNPRPAWKTWALFLRLAVTYSIYVLLMSAPSTVVRWLHL